MRCMAAQGLTTSRTMTKTTAERTMVSRVLGAVGATLTNAAQHSSLL